MILQLFDSEKSQQCVFAYPIVEEDQNSFFYTNLLQFFCNFCVKFAQILCKIWKNFVQFFWAICNPVSNAEKSLHLKR